MATFSKKAGGKEVGQAEVYAKPHTMSGGSESGAIQRKAGSAVMDEMNISVGKISKNLGPDAKTSGIKIRGTGAATKGTMARGPMA